MALCLARLVTPAQPSPGYLTGSLTKDEPQAIYAADPNHSWNRIFYCLFTRTVKARLSPEFKEGAPFIKIDDPNFRTLVSKRSFVRIEGGDRSIEPLYPTFMTADGALHVLKEPRYSKFRSALTDALKDDKQCTPLQRALMQSDVWAAYDVLAKDYGFEGTQGKQLLARRNQLMQLLARFIKKIALTPREIEALPDNYAAARARQPLPDLFNQNSGWMEIRWRPGRAHDDAADYHRAARVFVKPSLRLENEQDKTKFINRLGRLFNPAAQLDAVALVIQNLLIDSNGKVVPSRLTYEVQTRRFIKGADGKLIKTQLGQFELSRRLLLSNAKSGGIVALNDKFPLYLIDAGNDYGFATPQHIFRRPAFREQLLGEPVIVPLRTRCATCHHDDGTKIITFSGHGTEPVPAILKPAENEHVRYVAEQKMEREDFKALRRQWNR